MLGGQNGRAKHVEKPVHLCFHLIAKLPDRVMQTRRKLNWDLMRSRDHQRLGDLGRGWKRIGRHATSPQFVTESCSISFGVMLCDPRNLLFRPLARPYPPTRTALS